MSRIPRLSPADTKALLERLLREGWMSQHEMACWLEYERGIQVTCGRGGSCDPIARPPSPTSSQSTISRLLKRQRWSKKEVRRISLTQSREARQRNREEISRFPDEDLVFLDESIFNEKTGWRHMAYAPIGHEATYSRYSASVRRGKTSWSILAAMTLEGWLDCTGIKEGYYNRENLCSWLKESLLPALDRVYGRPIVIILDNCSTHIDEKLCKPQAISSITYHPTHPIIIPLSLPSRC